MSNEQHLPTGVQPSPNSLIEDASVAVEARIARIVGAGSFGFWIAFLAICLSSMGLLVLALFRP